jgi:hypothetical protein
VRHEPAATGHDALKDLAAALDVAPSPAFAARVRERVADQAPGARRWALWLALAAGGTVAAAVLVASVVWSRPDRNTPPVQRVAHDVVLPAAPGVQAGAPGLQARGDDSSLRDPSPGPGPGLLRSVVRVREPEVDVVEVIVPPDQAVAIRKWLQHLRTTRAAAPAGLEARASADIEPLPELKLLEIPLLAIEPLPAPESGVIGGVQ